MSQKRIFSKKITESDAFVDMPATSQLLYFHLNMCADDDGFVASPKRIMRTIGSTEDDFKVLVAKRFIIVFRSGVCVIKHWWIHNTLQKDRYIETAYIDEKHTLVLKENKSYTEGGKNVNKLSTICSPNIIQYNVKQYKQKPAAPKKSLYKDCVLLTNEELSKLNDKFGKEDADERIQRLNDYVMSKGVKYKSHYHTILNWSRKDSKDTKDNKVWL